MTPGVVRMAIVAERASWVRAMVNGIASLPLEGPEQFLADPRSPAAAESYLRRALEALLDLGRHLLAKGFAVAATEYKDIGRELHRAQILSEAEGVLLRRLAGYRNRLVHFYHEVSQEELYEICTVHVQDIEALLDRLLGWVRSHPEKTDAVG
jgi:uncharacterized protein YutE (UPF0331/DUF86 family)